MTRYDKIKYRHSILSITDTLDRFSFIFYIGGQVGVPICCPIYWVLSKRGCILERICSSGVNKKQQFDTGASPSSVSIPIYMLMQIISNSLSNISQDLS